MKKTFLAAFAAVVASVSYAVTAFSPADVFGDHMVLQRGRPIRFAGSGTPGMSVLATFHGEDRMTTVGADGQWVIEYPAEPAGGPYEVTFSPNAHKSVFSDLKISDVYVGELWLCSGQSNMEYPVCLGDNPFFTLPDGVSVVAAANDPKLRLMSVPIGATSAESPCTELPGRPTWALGTEPAAVGRFSATGYFFGRELRRRLPGDVAVGLVSAAWGGTAIEPWIPKSAFESAKMKPEQERIRRALRKPNDPDVLRERNEATVCVKDWFEKTFLTSNPKCTAEAVANWSRVDCPTNGWKRASRAEMDGLTRPGVVWYRFEYDLPAEWAGKPLVFHLDYVNDTDETYADGKLIGATSLDVPGYWAVPRDYPVAAASSGRHVLAVRAMDHHNVGYMGPCVQLRAADGTVVKDFSEGLWCERVEFVYDVESRGDRPEMPEPPERARYSQAVPSTLYNAMIHPLTCLNFGGTIWYQGCTNSERWQRYGKLQAVLIEAWRKAFRHPEMPFVLTQLSAFMRQSPKDRLPDDFWKKLGADECVGFAPMRAVQQTFLDYAYAGVACTIDIGDHSDIHPCRKAEVGRRLAHEAMRVAFGDETALPGPRGVAVTRLPGGKLKVTCRDTGAGLEVRGGKVGPHLFAVSDKAGVWTWADAERAADGSIVVSSPIGEAAVAVRYAWSAFPPDPPFYRLGDGLPLFPFSLRLPEAEEEGLFSVSRIFAAHMVVPRDVRVPVWGRGTPGQLVTVAFAGQTARGEVAADGMWCVTLAPMTASSEGRTMTLVSGNAKLSLEDCLVGDVWLCSGQSNMEFRFDQGEVDREKYAAESVSLPGIRWMKVDRRTDEKPETYAVALAWGGEASWQRASASFGRLSCVGYYAVRRLHRELGVPMGFVDAAWNGSKLEPFLPCFGADGALSSAVKGRGMRFNAMLAPLVKFPFKGALWYQGCADSGMGVRYAALQSELISAWRRAWGYDLPFYFAQLTAYGKNSGRPAGGEGFARVREGQRRTLSNTANIGMAVTFDVGHATDVHAPAKKLVGDRLAQCALAGAYGRSVVPMGPNCRAMTIEGNRIRLMFDHVGGGLVTGEKDAQTNDEPKLVPDLPLKGFVLAKGTGRNKKWHVAEATIDGETVLVSAPGVVAPSHVRYAYCADPRGNANLYNREGLPASPFSTEPDEDL